MVVIGLTGNLGSGKTTVAQMFAHLGADVLDADVIAHDLLTEDGPCRKKVCRAFPEAVDGDGRLDRQVIAREVFRHLEQLKILEEILHPAVKARMRAILQTLRSRKKTSMVVLDIPLLFESGLDSLADAVIVVRANRAQQINRVVKSRSMTRYAAEARLRRQMPQREKLKRADFIIDNRFSKAETRAQVKRIWDGLVRV